MKKLLTEEMQRLSVDQYRQSEKLPLVVVLDNIRSQNNIGSVFRTGDAFRIERVCLCGICSTPPHRDIHKTALGAEESVEWTYYEQTTDCVNTLKAHGYMVLAIEQTHDSISLDNMELTLCESLAKPAGIALVLGNEVEGVQEEVLALCDHTIEIPQYGTKHSLNVSCAAAIVMWQTQLMMRKNSYQQL